MKPIKFDNANRVLSAPPGTEDTVEPLHVFTDGQQCLSCWEPTAGEIEALRSGAKLWLHCVTGGTQPPVGFTIAHETDLFKVTLLHRDARGRHRDARA